MADLAHDKLLVYGRSLEAVVRLTAIARQFPAGWADLRDQLRRASTSIPLNIAEGAHEFSPPEKSRFYRMARRSAAECIAILDVADRCMRPKPEVSRTKSDLAEVIAMLSALVRTHSDR